jgi:hypothetical protein
MQKPRETTHALDNFQSFQATKPISLNRVQIQSFQIAHLYPERLMLAARSRASILLTQN